MNRFQDATQMMESGSDGPPSGAASSAPAEWHTIDWRAATATVQRLQARIVKATQEGRWGKVRALQHLLTHSRSGRALAVRRVTENRGRNTPGVDGATWSTPAEKTHAMYALRRRGYQPRPLRRVYIPKRNGKLRPLGIPTMHDRAMQALYLLALEPIAETTADPNSYGFRRGRSTADALHQCHKVLCHRVSAQWVLEGDIKSCFDRISHDWLLANIPMDTVMLRKWLQAGYMDKAVLHATDKGTPQGGIISPVLANMTLDGLERSLREHFPKGGVKPTSKVNVVRYADDFIVTGHSQELLATRVKPLVEAFLRERGLELSPEKTAITHVTEGFDFLGQNVRKYPGQYRGKEGTVLTKPSPGNVRTMLTQVREIIKQFQARSAGELIARLNPILQGWANYHRHGVSSDTFKRVDSVLYYRLWQWARRRHPWKTRYWIKDKYFGRKGQQNWVFTGEWRTNDGHRQQVWLVKTADTTIRRHVKIYGAANPFDPVWRPYFEARLGAKMRHTLRHQRVVLRLWREQGGRCPVCTEMISMLTGWHNHHIVWRSRGGSDATENRVLCHPTCHMQLHHSDRTVAKPRPAVQGVTTA